MTSVKAFLEKDRRRRDRWVTAMRRKFERVAVEFERVTKEIERRAREDEPAWRRKIREGTRRGLERARKRGVKLGGARRAGKSKIDLNELRRLRKLGHSQQRIAKRLHCSQALVSRKLAAQRSKKSKRGGKKK